MHSSESQLNSIEICAGAGGQALGLEMAGFEHLALVENDPWARKTLLANRPHWPVIEKDEPGCSFDVRRFSARPFEGVDLIAGGVPCPPFSVAGMRLGEHDERDLFPEALRLVAEANPRAVLLENVRGLLDPLFDDYRDRIDDELKSLGYVTRWRLLSASDFGVPQLRPRTIMVAFRSDQIGARFFVWPDRSVDPPTVGEILQDDMSSGGWAGAEAWAAGANTIAPTLVGGSKKHGGPDLGPTRARTAWARLGVDGRGLADAPPGPEFEGMPRLTVAMAAKIQGFPEDWVFAGRKTPAYKQVGNALPPPVAQAVGIQIAKYLRNTVEIGLPELESFEHTIALRQEYLPLLRLSR